MCELLGMSSNHKTTINLSLTTLAERGENPHLHGDGWGVAFYEGNDVRLIKDFGEAKGSRWVEFIKQQEIRSTDVIAHIRRSTVGEVSYKNTHPFIRELYGRMHTFAHNGTFHNIRSVPEYQTRRFKAVGTTDSEHAFCYLLDRMYEVWHGSDLMPSLEKRMEVVVNFAKEMRLLGPSNFLYSDGVTLFAHGHQRHDPLTDKLVWPGLHYIQVDCGPGKTGFDLSSKSAIAMKGSENFLTLFASVPLNKGEWLPIQEGEVIAVTKGEMKFSQMQTT